MIATIIILLLALLNFLLIYLLLLKVETKVKEAFSDPTWLRLHDGIFPTYEQLQNAYEHARTHKKERSDDEKHQLKVNLRKYYESERCSQKRSELELENTEFNYGHEVSKYHSDD